MLKTSELHIFVSSIKYGVKLSYIRFFQEIEKSFYDIPEEEPLKTRLLYFDLKQE